jgi:hypothetical protein
MYKYNFTEIENYVWNLNLNKFIKEGSWNELYNSLDIDELAEIVFEKFVNKTENDLSSEQLESIYDQLVNDTDFIALFEGIEEEINDMIYDLEETQYRKTRGGF